MHLTPSEQQMLSGEHGEATKLAMNILCDLGELYEAPRFIPITQAHIDMTLYMVDAGVEFAEKMAELGGQFAVPTQLNPASIDLVRHKELRVPESLLEKNRKLEKAYLKMGAIPSWTCAPYQQGLIPEFGEQVAWGESNAIAFVNSVIGARSERYADLTDICAAIAGRVPELGLHINKNRKAEVLIVVKGLPPAAFNDARIFPLLGFLFGETAGDRIAALQGVPTTISVDNLKAFSAATASAGAVGIFHILGITPEAPDIQSCFKNGRPTETLFITKDMIDDALSRLNQDGAQQPDLITLGCPHYSEQEFKTLAEALNRRKIKDGIEFWVFTSRNVRTKIETSGLLKIIEQSGIKVFSDGCALQYPVSEWNFKRSMTDSVKHANYCFSQTGLKVLYSTVQDCVETAVTGELHMEALWK